MLDGTITCETHALYALYFPSKYSNPKVRSFIDFLVAELGPLPAWDNWIGINASRLKMGDAPHFCAIPVWLYP